MARRIIVHTDFYLTLRVAKCVNAACTGTSIITVAADPVEPLVGGGPSIAIGAGGLPVISYVGRDGTTATLKVITCANAACTSASTVTSVVDDPAGARSGRARQSQSQQSRCPSSDTTTTPSTG